MYHQPVRCPAGLRPPLPAHPPSGQSCHLCSPQTPPFFVDHTCSPMEPHPCVLCSLCASRVPWEVVLPTPPSPSPSYTLFSSETPSQRVHPSKIPTYSPIHGLLFFIPLTLWSYSPVSRKTRASGSANSHSPGPVPPCPPLSQLQRTTGPSLQGMTQEGSMHRLPGCRLMMRRQVPQGFEGQGGPLGRQESLGPVGQGGQ